MLILEKDRIAELVQDIELEPLIEEGFVAYSEGEVVVPPVGEMVFKDPPGDVHIKYGFLKGDDFYVVKVASGFYENPDLGLPSGDGLMILFHQKTGQPLGLLLDQGWLTAIRTAVAGAIAARYLAPDPVERIGIVGSGTQARLQLRYLDPVRSCRKVTVLGVDANQVSRYREEMEEAGYEVSVAGSPAELCEACELIVTTTPAVRPILKPEHIRPGTHITAMGSDTPEKQELDCGVLAKADRVIADSVSQCLERGEISHALRAGILNESDVVELGDVIAGRAPGRTGPDDITVADLTGVAVQDLQIAKAVFRAAGGTVPQATA